MADNDAVEITTDGLADMLGKIGTGDEPVVDPAVAAPVVEPLADEPNEDLYADTSKEDLVELLKGRDKKYDGLRSTHDRQMNEFRESQKEQFEVLKQLVDQRGEQPAEAAPAIDNEAFVEEWSEKISPDDPERGKAIIDFLRGGIGDGLALMKAENAELRASLEGKLTKQDPDYQRHQKVVDELVDGGMPFNKAVDFVKKNMKSSAAAQPGTVQPPGRVATDTRSVPGAAPTSAVQVDASTASMLRMVAGSLGQDTKKFVDGITKSVAQERAGR